jgi:hypothetical protein
MSFAICATIVTDISVIAKWNDISTRTFPFPQDSRNVGLVALGSTMPTVTTSAAV